MRDVGDVHAQFPSASRSLQGYRVVKILGRLRVNCDNLLVPQVDAALDVGCHDPLREFLGLCQHILGELVTDSPLRYDHRNIRRRIGPVTQDVDDSTDQSVRRPGAQFEDDLVAFTGPGGVAVTQSNLDRGGFAIRNHVVSLPPLLDGSDKALLSPFEHLHDLGRLQLNAPSPAGRQSLDEDGISVKRVADGILPDVDIRTVTTRGCHEAEAPSLHVYNPRDERPRMREGQRPFLSLADYPV